MINPGARQEAVTLVELLATLIIAAMISSAIVYMISFELRSWQSVVPSSNVRSNVAFTSKELQQVFQNVSTTGFTVSQDGTEITGQDADGNPVDIRLQSTGIKARSDNIECLAITDNGKSQTIRFNDTSFGSYTSSGGEVSPGTTFSVDSGSPSLVDVNLVATYYGGGTPTTYQVAEQYALGGGD